MAHLSLRCIQPACGLVADDFVPWVLRDTAPSWVVAAISEEAWPERDVAHLLKRLAAEDVESIQFQVSEHGIATVELTSVTQERDTVATSQTVDSTCPRPLEDAIKRAMASLRSRRE